MTPYSIDNQIAASLHWFKVRCDLTVKHILMKYGVIPDPLGIHFREQSTPKKSQRV